jgi:hypothetical protein
MKKGRKPKPTELSDEELKGVVGGTAAKKNVIKLPPPPAPAPIPLPYPNVAIHE